MDPTCAAPRNTTTAPDPDYISDINSTGSYSDSGSDCSDDELTLLPPKPFRFFDLPEEIQKRIGRYAVDNYPGIYWWRLQDKRPGVKASPAIARTCQTLRRELLPYFLQTRVDMMCQNTDSIRKLRNVGAWLAAIDKTQRAQLQGVKMRVKGDAEPDDKQWERVRRVWKDVYGLKFEAVDEEVDDYCSEDDRVWSIKFL